MAKEIAEIEEEIEGVKLKADEADDVEKRLQSLSAAKSVTHTGPPNLHENVGTVSAELKEEIQQMSAHVQYGLENLTQTVASGTDVQDLAASIRESNHTMKLILNQMVCNNEQIHDSHI